MPRSCQEKIGQRKYNTHTISQGGYSRNDKRRSYKKSKQKRSLCNPRTKLHYNQLSVANSSFSLSLGYPFSLMTVLKSNKKQLKHAKTTAKVPRTPLQMKAKTKSQCHRFSKHQHQFNKFNKFNLSKCLTNTFYRSYISFSHSAAI